MAHVPLIVVPVELHQQCEVLLAILEEVLPVRFAAAGAQACEWSGEIRCGKPAAPGWEDTAGVSTLDVPGHRAAFGKETPVELAVNFSESAKVPLPFRGRSIVTTVAEVPRALALREGEIALATCGIGPVWVASDRDGVPHFRSAFAVPVIGPEGSLLDVLSGQRFLAMLPLFHWLRQIGAAPASQPAGLKACFIFDDPNLHWPKYGYVDYRQIVTHAQKENYHVSFATIPLDCWFTHPATAAIFRQHPSRISLTIHGNNHSKRELGRRYSERQRVSLLSQAITRIERLERRSGVAVSRVMVPPHGACSEEMLASLTDCGFEAACISHSSLRAHNKTKPWTRKLGFSAFELVHGCRVFPRWAVSGQVRNNVLLAAFLNQAIVLRAHHQDLRQGIELLDEHARLINGLGPVTWLNLTDLARSECVAMAGSADHRPPCRTGHTGRPHFTSFFRRILTEGRDRFLS